MIAFVSFTQFFALMSMIAVAIISFAIGRFVGRREARRPRR